MAENVTSWDNPADKTVGSDLLKEMEEQMTRIKHNLKFAQDIHKSYANKNRVFKDFKVDEHMFLKVKTMRSSLRLGGCPKLAARYCGPFEILEKIASFAYMLAFPSSMRVHNAFHVSLLKKYVPDPNHIIDWNVIQVEYKDDFWVEPVHILYQKVKVLRNKATWMVNVRWTCYGPEDAIWEHEENMWEEYLQFFNNFEEGRMQGSILEC
jgi:hypothetical protein